MPNLRIKNKGLKEGWSKAEREKANGKTRIALWKILGEQEIHPWKIIDTKEGYIIVIKEEYMEKALKMETKEELEKLELEISAPPEYKANRTLIVKRVDNHIDEYSIDELKGNIAENNRWMSIEELYKFKNGNFRTVKIVLENMQQIQKAMTEGVLIGNQLISPQSIEREIYVKIQQCNNCYSHDHKTDECKEEKIARCIKCGADGHTSAECTAKKLKCRNCHQEHNVFAAKCPIRKEIVKEKVKQLREKQKKVINTYAGAAKPIQTPVINQQNQTVNISNIIKIPENAITTILTSIVVGNLEEAAKPGSFQNIMDDMFNLNGLHKVKFPQKMNHKGILNLMGIAAGNATEEEKEISHKEKENIEERQTEDDEEKEKSRRKRRG